VFNHVWNLCMIYIVWLLQVNWIEFYSYTGWRTRRYPGKFNIICLTYWKTMVLWFPISYWSWITRTISMFCYHSGICQLLYFLDIVSVFSDIVSVFSNIVHLSFQRNLGFCQVHACILLSVPANTFEIACKNRFESFLH